MIPRLLLLGILFVTDQTFAAGLIIDACGYADDAAAQATWKGHEGSPPPTMQKVNGESALTFECKFGSSPVGRAYWDRKTELDLNEAEGLQLDIQCRNAGPISSFMLYLQTGDGWRSSTFSPRRHDGWETIVLRKSEMRDEGKPGDWGEITTVRLAAWKGNNTDTTFQIRNLRTIGVLGEDTHIVIVQSSDENDRPFGDTVSKMLGKLGLRHAMIPESKLNTKILAKAQLAILPHNPTLPDSAADGLIEYLKGGGRLLAFYSLPARLEEVTGLARGKHQKPVKDGQFSSIRQIGGSLPGASDQTLQASWNIVATKPLEGRSRVLAEWDDADGKPTGFPAVLASDNTVFMTHVLLDDDREHKARLLLATIGLLRSDFWNQVIASHREQMERVGNFESFAALSAHITGITKPGTEARTRLDEATQLRAEADHDAKEARYAQALDKVDLATRKLRESYCMAQPSKPGEFRAMWCHSAFGVKGLSWDEAIARLKDNGFTAIMPNMLWGGVAYYPSEVLPVAADIAERGDQMEACVAACKKHGLQIHVWKVDWNLGRDVPAAFVDKMRAEGRLQHSFSGEEQPWLCPSNPANVQMERESLLEVARNYPIDGIHFDYIRYPGADHCFCAPCRERFEKATGKPVVQWPKDVQMKGSRREEWIVWCQNNISTLVQTTSEQVRQVRPGIKVSAAVFRNWDVDSRIVMQDWKLWCQKGWLDFVCPMNYTNNDSTYEAWVRRQRVLAGPAELVPGIGASASNSSLSADAVISQIEITRKHNAKGFIIFNYGQHEADETIPLLGLGVTKRER